MRQQTTHAVAAGDIRQTVRDLADTAGKATTARAPADELEGQWAGLFKAAVDAGFSEKDLTKLKPPAGARPAPARAKKPAAAAPPQQVHTSV